MYHLKSSPVHNVQDLLDGNKSLWNPLNKCSIPLDLSKSLKNSKLLLCHDFAGGYKEDADIQGTFLGDNNDFGYSCQYLHFVDVFCYFSHHLVTIPPLQWTIACHRQKIPCIGTVIVEWERGIDQIMNLMYGPNYRKEFESRQRDFDPYFADRLVDVAEYYGFDGYLINIESPLPSSTHTFVLKRFVQYLTKRIHQRIPNSQIIWYDSVIYNGKLRWQDQVNEKNEMFFNSCDAIFTNYTWNIPRLLRSAYNANDRKADVYTGIDVWGRNTFGGGGFNCHKALREIQRVGTSTALFAPGWTYENLGAENFDFHETRFWVDHSLLPLPTPDWDLGCISDYSSSKLINYPFMTSFCRGYGSQLALNGSFVNDKNWKNLALQDLQPNIYPLSVFARDSNLDFFVSIDSSVSFHGGHSLLIAGSMSACIAHLDIFHTRLNSLQFKFLNMVFKCPSDLRIGFCVMYIDGTKSGYFSTPEQDSNDWLNIKMSFDSNGKTIIRLGIVFTFESNVPDVVDLDKCPVDSQTSNQNETFTISIGKFGFVDQKREIPAFSDTLQFSQCPQGTLISWNIDNSDSDLILGARHVYLGDEWLGAVYNDMFITPLSEIDPAKVRVQVFCENDKQFLFTIPKTSM